MRPSTSPTRTLITTFLFCAWLLTAHVQAVEWWDKLVDLVKETVTPDYYRPRPRPAKLDPNRPDVPQNLNEIKTSETFLTIDLTYTAPPPHQAVCPVKIRHEDVGKCIWWVAVDTISRQDNGFDPILYRGNINPENFYANKISIAGTTNVIVQRNGKEISGPFGRTLGFFQDDKCMKLLGTNRNELQGQTMRPAAISMADLRSGAGQSAAAAYLTGTKIPTEFWTLFDSEDDVKLNATAARLEY